jgi:endonuclease YncB( thermonuclease family)
LLRYVYLLDGTFVKAELVAGGFARAEAYAAEFADLEQGARMDRRGMRAVCWQWVESPRVGR